MLTKAEAYLVIDRILGWAGSLDVQIRLSGQDRGLTRFAGSEIHQNVSQEDLTVELIAVDGKRRARVTTNRLGEEDLKEALRELQRNLEVAPEAELEIPFITEPEDIYDEEYDPGLLEEFDIEGRAGQLESGLKKLQNDREAAGSLSLDNGFLALGNSSGITRYARRTQVDFSTVVNSGDSTGFAALISDKSEDLDISRAFSQAADKAHQGRDPVQLEPGSYPVILEPLAVGGILSYLSYVGFSARSVQKGMSFLADRLGEQVFGKNITITDNCEHPETANLPFDLEGARRQKLTIIEEGVARELAYDLKSAILDEKETTGHSIGRPDIGGFPLHLVMEPGESSQEEMISSLDRGLLITRFHYMNIVNPRQAVFTGLTRDGTFLIEKGEITAPVQDLRFTDSMLDAFNKVAAISPRREKVEGFSAFNYVPALQIEELKFTGRKES